MDNRIIGFDRELTLPWLDSTAGLAQADLNVQRIRQELTARLAKEIPGQEACRKTITLLTRIWVRVPPEHRVLQSEALSLISTVLPEERLWLHWGMSLLAYPFFHDVAATTGRLLKLQPEFSSVQVQRRMREAWGQRTTLERAVSRLLKTYVAWKVTAEASEGGYTYRVTGLRQITDEKLALWFMACLMWSSRQANGRNDLELPLLDLLQSPAIFPFDLTAHIGALRRSTRFEISRQGLNLEMVTPV